MTTGHRADFGGARRPNSPPRPGLTSRVHVSRAGASASPPISRSSTRAALAMPRVSRSPGPPRASATAPYPTDVRIWKASTPFRTGRVRLEDSAGEKGMPLTRHVLGPESCRRARRTRGVVTNRRDARSRRTESLLPELDSPEPRFRIEGPVERPDARPRATRTRSPRRPRHLKNRAVGGAPMGRSDAGSCARAGRESAATRESTAASVRVRGPGVSGLAALPEHLPRRAWYTVNSPSVSASCSA